MVECKAASWNWTSLPLHGLKNHAPTIDQGQLKALIFDVDGTLYRQGPVRRTMLGRLLREHVGNPMQGLLTLRVLRAYRKAQEVLRTPSSAYSDLAEEQLRLACKWTGVRLEVVRVYVDRWMEREPLEPVARSLCEGVRECLQVAVKREMRLGVFSDYPPAAKLTAMGVEHFFDVLVSAQDPEVQKFKPSPRGLEVALQRLGVERRQALYIGDRPEVDAAAARDAGVACVIIGRLNVVHRHGWIELAGYKELKDVICRQ